MPNQRPGLPQTLYIATTNPGKLRDFSAAAGPGITIEPLPGLAAIPAPAEDELTFEGNARVKALAYAAYAPGAIVLADDSGLEVDALHGAPGVRSARYADDTGYPPRPGLTPDQRNNACLLAALPSIPATPYTARYRCALAAVRDGQILALADGIVEGEILNAPRGTSGFGYDPLFFLPQFSRTMAELDPATRLAHSHRGNALRLLLTLLNS
jgi:XTP/dITP diphosphohydrolase